MRKRERENPCGICGHYHKYEEGEVCSICGHRVPDPTEKSGLQVSAFPSEILPEFLYLGSYDNASRSELLKTQGISRILNVRFLRQCLLVKISTRIHLPIIVSQMTKRYPLMMQLQFLEQCENDKARVLVHCMSGKNRSPAIVIAFLMKCKGWRLAQSYQWVKERRPSTELTEGVYQQLQEYEQKIFGSFDSRNPVLPVFPPAAAPSFSFGFPKNNDPTPLPAFSSAGATSIFAHPQDIPPHEFTFGAGRIQNNVAERLFNIDPPNPNGNDVQMDSS
ncbi:protein-tyrosine-phosphatase IBR5-like [Quillaja saponaria]|uniref:Protein-tyrosine-phosphatase IBR5-like n=1 Tax=Quillaja saponaria TaxID=32244 RepID=A0AAD7PLL7_QUISA|nr:protein-tyrosine-phosphatase IBR5-like [Quillaja saponaria]